MAISWGPTVCQPLCWALCLSSLGGGEVGEGATSWPCEQGELWGLLLLKASLFLAATLKYLLPRQPHLPSGLTLAKGSPGHIKLAHG